MLVGVQIIYPWRSVLFDYIVFGSEGASALGKEKTPACLDMLSAANGSRGTREGGGRCLTSLRAHLMLDGAGAIVYFVALLTNTSATSRSQSSVMLCLLLGLGQVRQQHVCMWPRAF